MILLSLIGATYIGLLCVCVMLFLQNKKIKDLRHILYGKASNKYIDEIYSRISELALNVYKLETDTNDKFVNVRKIIKYIDGKVITMSTDLYTTKKAKKKVTKKKVTKKKTRKK